MRPVVSRFDFQSAVLDRSREVPVVVDFWAPWCGPCRALSPVIEDLAAAAAGRWELVKVNTDHQPDLARRLGIMSIPAVKMFHHGRAIAEFVGALPRESIHRWLDSHLPDPGAGRLAAIAARWPEEGAAVAAELEALVAERPDLPEARLRLAQAIVGREPDRARGLIHEASPDADLTDLSADVASLADLMECAEPPPARMAPHLEAARRALRDHDLDGALDHLVEMVTIDRRFAGELPRRAAVALFRLLGQAHALTGKHRRRLSMALHA
jgi:putative thioredoxin